jgi:hypothetical protein
MTLLESKIAQLLAHAEPLFERSSLALSHKWVAVDATQARLSPVQDKGTSFAVSWSRARSKLETLPSFNIAMQAFGRDPVFAEAARAAGYWGTFDAVLQEAAFRATYLKRGRLLIDQAKAIAEMQELRRVFAGTHLRFEGSARLFGIKTKRRVLQLPDEVKLVRLTSKEKAERQPLVHIGFSNEDGDYSLLQQDTEISVPITIPLERTAEGSLVEGALFKATNAAQKIASELFATVSQALLLAFHGNVAVGPIQLRGGSNMPYAMSSTKDTSVFGTIKIGSSDLPRVSTAYDLIAGGRSSDKTLNRALHRFLLGRQRSDAMDKLVDYVIAWEAVLLTQAGNAAAQELSYRFGVNGASLLVTVRKKKEPMNYFKQMRSAYSARSAVVHGGTDAQLRDALAIGAFRDFGEMLSFLENSFRETVFWLASISPEARPYRKAGGWESLMWPGTESSVVSTGKESV